MSNRDVTLLTLAICSIGALLAMNFLYFPLSVPWLMEPIRRYKAKLP